MSNARAQNPYAPSVLESHLCAGCGRELRRVAAPPDPVYALPVCICPGCGLACVRRNHRLRTYPIAFRRLDRAFNRLALAGGCVALFAGTSLLIAVFMSLQAERTGREPFTATIGAIRSAPIEELLSIWLAIGGVGMILAISGVLMSRLLWHWKSMQLLGAWAGVLVVVSVLPVLVPIAFWDADAITRDLGELWPSRLQALAMCWVATAVGVPLDRATGQAMGPSRKFGRSLRWARKRIKRRQAG